MNSSPVVDVLTVYGGFDHEISQPVIPEVGIVKQDKKTTGLPIKLAVLGANNKGLPYYQLTLYDKTTIGRRSPADLIIENDEQISALHCEITLETGRVYIRDLGSTNGTMINGVPIAGKYCLQNEDLLLVGKTELRISLP